MKHVVQLISIIAIMCISIQLFPNNEGKYIGKIRDKKKGEVIISSNPSTIRMGMALYTRVKGKVVRMTASFPMVTVTKCTMTGKHKKYYKRLKKGLKVYQYNAFIKNRVKKKDKSSYKKYKELLNAIMTNSTSDAVGWRISSIDDMEVRRLFFINIFEKNIKDKRFNTMNSAASYLRSFGDDASLKKRITGQFNKLSKKDKKACFEKFFIHGGMNYNADYFLDNLSIPKQVDFTGIIPVKGKDPKYCLSLGVCRVITGPNENKYDLDIDVKDHDYIEFNYESKIHDSKAENLPNFREIYPEDKVYSPEESKEIRSQLKAHKKRAYRFLKRVMSIFMEDPEKRIAVKTGNKLKNYSVGQYLDYSFKLGRNPDPEILIIYVRNNVSDFAYQYIGSTDRFHLLPVENKLQTHSSMIGYIGNHLSRFSYSERYVSKNPDIPDEYFHDYFTYDILDAMIVPGRSKVPHAKALMKEMKKLFSSGKEVSIKKLRRLLVKKLKWTKQSFQKLFGHKKTISISDFSNDLRGNVLYHNRNIFDPLHCKEKKLKFGKMFQEYKNFVVTGGN